MPITVLQFGTSRFLQAHALAYLQAGEPTGAPPEVCVVQTTSNPARRRRLQALAAPGGYPVQVRGLENGRPVEREERVQVVKAALALDADYAEVERIFCHEARWILSNTADRGFEAQDADHLPHPAPGQSYPARLYHLMRARHAAGQGPLTILPTELVSRNGDALRERVLEIARLQGAGPGLMAALEAHVWVNSLVDRIVSAEIEPAGAVAEPYGLWAIEDCPGLDLPVLHPAIEVVTDLEPIARLKLHVLNLGHTALVALWQRAGEPVAFVREAMDHHIGAELLSLWREEVLPGFARRGMGEAAADYLEVTLSRFRNPYLDHRISDIAQNHAAKVEHRIKAFLDWTGQGRAEAPRLHALVEGMARQGPA